MLTYEEFKSIYNSKEYGRMGALYFARQLGLSITIVIKYVKQYERENKKWNNQN